MSMVDVIVNGEPVFVSQILQKAFVEVNEEGTEAAAATMMMAVASCAVLEPPPPQRFICDRPFSWAIVQKDSNMPLFYGKMLSF